VSDLPKTIVYILRSETDLSKHYVGLTSDLVRRLAEHNAGLNVHTARARRWRVLVSMEFVAEKTAACFERYVRNRLGTAPCSKQASFEHPVPRCRSTQVIDAHGAEAHLGGAWRDSCGSCGSRGLSTPVEDLTVPPSENLTVRRRDEPQVVATS
jgi:predicted GIY-YIG superfamily endonuclease